VTHACAAQGSSLCFTGSTLEPKEGSAGTSFRMRICRRADDQRGLYMVAVTSDEVGST
jgi:hypothetical protein